MLEDKVIIKIEDLNKTFLYKWIRDNYKLGVRDALEVVRECKEDNQIDFYGDLNKALKFLSDAPEGISLRLVTDVLYNKPYIPIGNVFNYEDEENK